MKKSLFCLYASALFLITRCGCNSTSKREEAATIEQAEVEEAEEEKKHDEPAAPTRVYARDLSTANVKGYRLHQDVATVIENWYRNNDNHNLEINKDGKIKDYNVFCSADQHSFGVDGNKLSDKHSTYEDGVLDYSRTEEYDDKHRTIRIEGKWASDPYPSIYQFIYEDNDNVTYETRINTNAPVSPNIPRYKHAEYDENHRLIRKYDTDGVGLLEEWKETATSETQTVYESGAPVRKSVYDDKGRPIEYWVRRDDNLCLSTTTEYDDANNIKTYTHHDDDKRYKEICFFTDGYAHMTKRYIKNRSDEITAVETYDYDTKGNVIRSVGQYNTTQYSYEYDSKGNWIVKVTDISDRSFNPSSIYIRHIRYFDGYDSDKDLQEVLWKYVAGAASPSGNSNQGNSVHSSQPAVVEHHGAAQVWVPCGACNNSGECQTCLGTGRSLMSGNECIICGGNKKCRQCAGQGGHYEMRTY